MTVARSLIWSKVLRVAACALLVCPSCSGPKATYYFRNGRGGPLCLRDSDDVHDVIKQPHPANDRRLRRRDVLRDREILRQILSDVYVGFRLEDKVDWVGFWKNWQRRVSVATSFDMESAFVEPLAEIREKLGDRHLGVSGWADAKDLYEYQSTVPASLLDSVECVTTLSASISVLPRIRPLLLRDGGVDRVISVSAPWVGDSLPLQCGEMRLALKVRPRGADDGLAPGTGEQAPRWSHDRASGVSWIRIAKLWGEGLSEVLVKEGIPDSTSLVLFDLRGNAGGDDEPVYEWIDTVCRHDWYDYVSVELKSPCASWNMSVLRAAYGGGEPSAALSARDRRGERDIRIFDGRRICSGLGGERFRGKNVVALIDSKTRSSGESAAEALRRSVGALIVGERSRGALTYTNALAFVLPYTGTVVRVPTKWNFYGESYEFVGLPVDAYLQDVNADTEEVAKLLAANFDELLASRP